MTWTTTRCAASSGRGQNHPRRAKVGIWGVLVCKNFFNVFKNHWQQFPSVSLCTITSAQTLMLSEPDSRRVMCLGDPLSPRGCPREGVTPTLTVRSPTRSVTSFRQAGQAVMKKISPPTFTPSEIWQKRGILIGCTTYWIQRLFVLRHEEWIHHSETEIAYCLQH